MTLSEFTAITGLCFGLAGFVLGVLNYVRDRHRIDVLLQWDMEVSEGSGFDHTQKWGVIRVTNVGRRASYVSHVAIRVPSSYGHSHLLISSGIQGKKLSEGDPSEVYMVNQEGMNLYAKDWKNLVAQINDSTGKTWKSKKLRKAKKPSWAD
ncbi:MAG: hypothetical protein U5M53_02430 [Rhodoferax sp.]|nr:hypothetical protein [Rhodoferax sp.]